MSTLQARQVYFIQDLFEDKTNLIWEHFLFKLQTAELPLSCHAVTCLHLSFFNFINIKRFIS